MISLLLFDKVAKAKATSTIYYEIAVVPKTYGHKSNLYGSKSAYEISKDLSKYSRIPNLSDEGERSKEREDEESRPSHMKKQILFKSFIDMMGESAMIPWFREVEKIVKIRKTFRDRTYITTVIVIINSRGEVVKVVIDATSGDIQLDLAVKNAFLGQVYTRPPRDLIDKDGFGRVKWIFEMYLDVDLTRKGKFRLYRRE